jgi:hypothetical protein
VSAAASGGSRIARQSRGSQALRPRSVEAAGGQARHRLVRAANRSSPRTHLIAIALSSPGSS